MRSRYALALAAIIVLGCLRIASTWTVFSATADEPAHVASGIEWLDGGTYALEPTHPPLARALAAAGPWLAGARFRPVAGIHELGAQIFYTRGPYLRMVVLGRSGVLVFFVVTTLIAAAWARSLFGDAGGLAAAALLTSEPSFLAHSALATTDGAAAAGTIAVAYAVDRWLACPAAELRRRNVRVLVAGCAIGLAVISKFSALLFIPAVLLPVLIARIREARHHGLRLALEGAGALVTGAIVVWAGYRFSFGPTSAWPAMRVPAPELWNGIGELARHNASGHKAFLLGEMSQKGWWYYFPVALAFKCTIAFLLLALAGVYAAFASASRSRERVAQLVPAAAGLCVLLASMTASINIGVRHVLPVFPFMAISGGAAIAWLWRAARTPRARAVALVPLVLAGAPSLLAHPDYLSYFNAFAGREPERILVDSNLDWGQDMLRLARVVEERRITELAIGWVGSAHPTRHLRARVTALRPWIATTGWIAISETERQAGGHEWLRAYEPVQRVGASIRLYNVPAAPRVEIPSVRPGSVAFLLPLWLASPPGGASWVSEVTVTNESDRPLAIRSSLSKDQTAVLDVPARSTIERADFGPNAEYGLILFVDDARRKDVRIAMKLLDRQHPDAAPLVIPVVPEEKTGPAALQFPGVQVSALARVNLRIYDLLAHEAGCAVRVYDAVTREPLGEISEMLARRDPPERHPASTRIDLAQRLPAMRGRRVQIVAEINGPRGWGFLTVDAPGQQSLVLVPELQGQ